MSKKKGAKQARKEDKKEAVRNKEKKRCEKVGERKLPKDRNTQGTGTDTKKQEI